MVWVVVVVRVRVLGLPVVLPVVVLPLELVLELEPLLVIAQVLDLMTGYLVRSSGALVVEQVVFPFLWIRVG